MQQPKHYITNDPRYDGSFFEHPRIALLDEKHWLYIQRRYQMTPRELQVAKLVCQGFNNGEITKNLKIKHGTAKTHLRNIYRKIRVKNKLEMLLKFVTDATKFSVESGITPPAVPIVDITKPGYKIPSLPEKPRKE
ncbi:MAG: response regulator transcription factor [Planctomycetota bacterium]|jgi:DNA-binding CsgD family transcriptional regulator